MCSLLRCNQLYFKQTAEFGIEIYSHLASLVTKGSRDQSYWFNCPFLKTLFHYKHRDNCYVKQLIFGERLAALFLHKTHLIHTEYNVEADVLDWMMFLYNLCYNYT